MKDTEGDEVQLFICINGKQKPIMASSKETIGAIEEQTNNHDRWMYAGKVFSDDLRICHYNIADGTTIFPSPVIKR